MEKEWIRNLKMAVECSNYKHKIIIWGASTKSDSILSMFKEWGCTVVGYVDRKADTICEYNELPVYEICRLQEEKYFVYVALSAHHADVLSQLDEFGYTEFVNFWYPHRLVDLDGTVNYEDAYGNSLVTKNINPLVVRLRSGGKAEINTSKLNSNVKIASAGDAYVRIGEGVSFGERVVVSSTNGTILIGDKCKFDSFIKLRTSCGGRIDIGKMCSLQRDCAIVASFNARIILGEDCMVSYSVFMRAGNSHNMIDLDTLEHFDDNSNRDVILGEHVWVGMRVTLLNGVEIGSGSTVGANSFVCKKKFPNNCCVAGNPARILRERTAWIRDGKVMHKNIEDYESFIYSDLD